MRVRFEGGFCLSAAVLPSSSGAVLAFRVG